MSSEAPDVSAAAPMIVETPGICGGSPPIFGTRLPIWGLEAARRAGRSDQSILEAYPALTPAALELASRTSRATGKRLKKKSAKTTGRCNGPYSGG